ncbi:MAG: Smr/MutS family protein [Bacteroidota bacterium]|nr:Smr/MutS family protein [Bacteroidota bacterium]
MVNLNDLWIGDCVYLKHENVRGIFQGFDIDNNGLFLIGNQRIVSLEREFEIVEESLPDVLESLSKDKIPILKPKEKNQPSKSIDLHMEILNPGLTLNNASEILKYQLNEFKIFLEKSISNKQFSITIIHGKGEGILRNEVRSLLRSDPRIKIFKEANDNGATDVWL